ncbi:uncharacterized protein LOC114305088 [Camellia sinensis]|uniref:uncharacterized protein LOC114305088 n=1 Tax=Camellia sinensis TaxID=4442 RepID=UPI001035750E|nr:uncharacterized protein LOC114305088 [Camellia sinensis]
MVDFTALDITHFIDFGSIVQYCATIDWFSSGGRSGHLEDVVPISRAHQSSAVDTLDSNSTSVTQASDTELEDALRQLLDRRSSTALSTASSSFARSGQDKVRIADGTVSSISGKGLVQVTPTMHLSSVLHVPKFSVNLLSLSRLTQDLNCCVTFFPDHCLFQDLVTGRTIGSGSAENGLYFLDLTGQTCLFFHHVFYYPR